MAGRPVKMAEKVEAFTSRAYCLAREFGELMPQQYHERHCSNDPVCAAWQEAMAATARCLQAIGQLEEVLVIKAIRVAEANEKRGSVPQ
jgi:hypothetical protein